MGFVRGPGAVGLLEGRPRFWYRAQRLLRWGVSWNCLARGPAVDAALRLGEGDTLRGAPGGPAVDRWKAQSRRLRWG